MQIVDLVRFLSSEDENLIIYANVNIYRFWLRFFMNTGSYGSFIIINDI